MSAIAVQVFGTVDVEVDGERKRLSPAQRTVLAVLVAAGSAGLSADALATEIWIDELPRSWNASVRNAIGRIRKLVGSSAIESVGGKYRLAMDENAVDYWRLLAAAAQTERDIDLHDLTRLLDGEPFPEIGGGDRLRSARDQTVAARHGLVERFIATTDDLSPTALATLHAYARRNQFDHRMVSLVHGCLVAAGATEQAQSLIADLSPPASPERSESAGIKVPSLARARTLPTPVARMARTAIVARDQQVATISAAIEDGIGAMVIGLSGIGKSSVASQVGAQLFDNGFDVLYGVAQSDQVSMAPFLAAMPGFAQRFAELIGQAHPSAAHHAMVCAEVRDHIERNHGPGGRPVCLILDDAHVYDALSLQATAFLMRCAPETRIRVLVAAQPAASPEFESFLDEIHAIGVTSCELERLNREEQRALARAVHPDAYDLVLDRLVDEVVGLSAGLPGVASFVIRQAAPQTLLLPSFDTSNTDIRVFDPFVRRLDAATIEAGAAGAVRGMRFQVQDLVDAVGLDEADALRACEELTAAGFTRESDRPDEFVFMHLLLRNALLASASKARLGRLHRRMAQQTNDIHRRARHLAAALPLAPGEEAAQALLESARTHMESLSWREAAAAFRESAAIDATFTRFDDRVAFAAALDLSGADGSLVRAEAFELAASEGTWGAALDAACSGLPGAERVDGDPQRFALLARIPADALTEPQQARLREQLTRQATFVGKPVPIADRRAAESEPTSIERFISSGVVGRLPEDFTAGNTFEDCDDPTVRARALQLQWIFDLERSPRQTSSRVRRQLEVATVETGDAVRDWHLKIAIGLDLRLKGEWRAADWVAQDALTHGDRSGIGDARAAALAQRVFLPWLTGRLSDFGLDNFDPADVGTSLPIRGLQVACQAAQSNTPAVAESVRTITAEMVSTPSLYTVPLLVVLSSAIASHADEDTARLANEVLAERAGTCAVLANGVLHAGPIDRALAHLAADPRERQQHLDAAVTTADSTGVELWQVMTRLEAAADGAARRDLIGEAFSIAAGTDLEQLCRQRLAGSDLDLSTGQVSVGTTS